MSLRPEQYRMKRAIMNMLRERAEAGEPAPRNRDIADHVGAVTVREVELVMIHIRRNKMIAIERAGSHDRRIFVPGTGWTDWSRPMDTSVFAGNHKRVLPREICRHYDEERIAAAMKGRRFEDHNAPEWRRSYPQSAPLNYSVTGCTALECAV